MAFHSTVMTGDICCLVLCLGKRNKTYPRPGYYNASVLYVVFIWLRLLVVAIAVGRAHHAMFSSIAIAMLVSAKEPIRDLSVPTLRKRHPIFAER